MEAVLLMARTSTITVLANRLVAAVSGFVLVSAIVTGMTTRAVRLERCILPNDHL